MSTGHLIRFAAVGVTQNAFNVLVFAILLEVGLAYGAAAVLSALGALLLSFLLQRSWTFVDAPLRRAHLQLLRYSAVFAAAVGAGLVLLYIQIEKLDVAPVPAQLIAVLVVAPASFLLQRFWVFA